MQWRIKKQEQRARKAANVRKLRMAKLPPQGQASVIYIFYTVPFKRLQSVRFVCSKDALNGSKCHSKDINNVTKDLYIK